MRTLGLRNNESNFLTLKTKRISAFSPCVRYKDTSQRARTLGRTTPQNPFAEPALTSSETTYLILTFSEEIGEEAMLKTFLKLANFKLQKFLLAFPRVLPVQGNRCLQQVLSHPADKFMSINSQEKL